MLATVLSLYLGGVWLAYKYEREVELAEEGERDGSSKSYWAHVTMAMLWPVMVAICALADMWQLIAESGQP